MNIWENASETLLAVIIRQARRASTASLEGFRTSLFAFSLLYKDALSFCRGTLDDWEIAYKPPFTIRIGNARKVDWRLWLHDADSTCIRKSGVAGINQTKEARLALFVKESSAGLILVAGRIENRIRQG